MSQTKKAPIRKTIKPTLYVAPEPETSDEENYDADIYEDVAIDHVDAKNNAAVVDNRVLQQITKDAPLMIKIINCIDELLQNLPVNTTNTKRTFEQQATMTLKKSIITQSMRQVIKNYEYLTPDALTICDNLAHLLSAKTTYNTRTNLLHAREAVLEASVIVKECYTPPPQINLTEEQQAVIDALLRGENVIVDSVPGSGKTTLILGYIEALHKIGQSVLAITYSSRLKDDSRKKLAALTEDQRRKNTLKPLQQDACVSQYHSFHSLCNKFFYQKTHTDSDICHVLKNKTAPREQIKFTTIIIDEAQDMTDNAAALLRHTLGAMRSPVNICFIGDQFQSIHAFLGASSQHFLQAEKNFGELVVDKPWNKLSLSMSFRLPKKICDFVNASQNYRHAIGKDMTKRREIMSFHADEPNMGQIDLHVVKNTILTAPTCGGFKSGGRFAVIMIERIKQLLDTGTSVDEIFLLFPSVKDNGFLKTLKNTIAAKGMAKLFHVSKGEGSQEEMLEQKGKIIITTYHQSKGLERDHVFVFYFDSKFVEVFHKTYDYDTLTNEHYVALTRAKKGLHIISSDASYDVNGEKQQTKFFHFMPTHGYDNIYYYLRQHKKEVDLRHNDFFVQCFNEFICFMRRKYSNETEFKRAVKHGDIRVPLPSDEPRKIRSRIRAHQRIQSLFKKYLVAWQEAQEQPANKDEAPCNFDNLSDIDILLGRSILSPAQSFFIMRNKILYREHNVVNEIELQELRDQGAARDEELNNIIQDQEVFEMNHVSAVGFKAVQTECLVGVQKVKNMQRVDDLYAKCLPYYIKELMKTQKFRAGNIDTQFISGQHYDMRLIDKNNVIARCVCQQLLQNLDKYNSMRYEQIKDSGNSWFDLIVANNVLTILLAGIRQVVLKDVVDDELSTMKVASGRMRDLLMKDYETRLDECLSEKNACYEKTKAGTVQLTTSDRQPQQQFLIFGRIVIVASTQNYATYQCKKQMCLQKEMHEALGEKNKNIKGYVVEPSLGLCMAYVAGDILNQQD